ncbi:hypothetical protein CHH58_05155 [Terribacillus saccharophilus]|uniref:hypothetical protein n=1 Tax=Terribacillus saccharophilus TaxID=361277 RepID=UPI000BA51AFD|nr:hypothetical protein [Terribacillus saccharophilus]PAF38813.1 hypothetical protein CHH58_05155 [Terribacillus saccharophilus]
MKKYYGLFSLISSLYLFFFYEFNFYLNIIAIFSAIALCIKAPLGFFKVVSGFVLGALLIIVVGIILFSVIAGLGLRSIHYN